mgnify:CR=1 FL=1
MKTIGIIGGMGPLATVDLFQKIILATKASKDQEHIPILIDNNTAVPDRTAAILGQGPDPVPELVKSARRLKAQGADFLIMACNTAHFFLPEVETQVEIPFINMLEETAAYCKKCNTKKAGLLATPGIYRSGIYHRAFEKLGVGLMEPNDRQAETVHKVIYEGVKAGRTDYDVRDFRNVLRQMQSEGADCFVLGCTEMPLAVTLYNIPGRFVDATQVLAEAAVRRAGAECLSSLE